jgi:hypothetical protein
MVNSTHDAHIAIALSETVEYSRRTGLAEVSRVAESFGPSRSVRIYSPLYPGIVPDPAAHPRHVLVPVGGEMPGVQNGRIQARLPALGWDTFAEAVLADLDSTADRAPRECLWAVDWPLAGLVLAAKRRLPGLRIVYTVDLPPPGSVVDSWLHAIRTADVVHAPTRYWWNYLASLYPELRDCGGRVRTLRFGFEGRDFVYDTGTPGARTEACDRILRKAGSPPADDSTVVMVIGQRFTGDDPRDDQKGYGILYGILADIANLNGGNVRLLVRPVNADAAAVAPGLLSKYKRAAEEDARVRVLEGTGKEWPWIDLLLASHIQLCPSRLEPSSINPFQGAAVGTVPVCTPVGAMAEPPVVDYQRDRGHGNAFISRDVGSAAAFEAIAAAVDLCAGDASAWQELAERAVQMARESTWQALGRSYLSLVLGGTAGNGG